ncbi:MAG: hypothetical protein M3P23_16835 [Actinomycetota bacterium]|nr:hypothetical protein [Actinomycetota bacterium]
MHAVFVEVEMDEERAQHMQTALQVLGTPRLRALGAVSYVALAPRNGRAVAIAEFPSEAAASKAASTMREGGQAGPNPMTRFRTVEVREVLVRL